MKYMNTNEPKQTKLSKPLEKDKLLEQPEKELLPEGEYLFRIHKPYVKVSNSGNEGIILNLNVLEGELAGKWMSTRLSYQFWEHKQRIVELMDALGIQEIEDVDVLHDKKIRAQVSVKHSDFHAREINEVVGFSPASESVTAKPGKNTYEAAKNGDKAGFDDEIPF